MKTVAVAEADFIAKEVAHFGKFPGASVLGARNATVTFVARPIIEWLDAHPGTHTVAAAIDGAFVEGWFVRHFYAIAIAEMIYREWLTIDGDTLARGPKWLDAVAHAANIRAFCEASQATHEKRMAMRQEGLDQVLASLPASVQAAVERERTGLYCPGGTNINSANYCARVQPGYPCLVEFGKRHHHFDSKITRRREVVSATWYVRAIITDLGAGRHAHATIEVGGEPIRVEAYRISKVFTPSPATAGV